MSLHSKSPSGGGEQASPMGSVLSHFTRMILLEGSDSVTRDYRDTPSMGKIKHPIVWFLVFSKTSESDEKWNTPDPRDLCWPLDNSEPGLSTLRQLRTLKLYSSRLWCMFSIREGGLIHSTAEQLQEGKKKSLLCWREITLTIEGEHRSSR